MSTFIVVTRNPNPQSNGLLVIVGDDQETPEEFNSEAEADTAAEKVAICRAWGHQVLEVTLPRHKDR